MIQTSGESECRERAVGGDSTKALERFSTFMDKVLHITVDFRRGSREVCTSSSPLTRLHSASKLCPLARPSRSLSLSLFDGQRKASGHSNIALTAFISSSTLTFLSSTRSEVRRRAPSKSISRICFDGKDGEVWSMWHDEGDRTWRGEMSECATLCSCSRV